MGLRCRVIDHRPIGHDPIFVNGYPVVCPNAFKIAPGKMIKVEESIWAKTCGCCGVEFQREIYSRDPHPPPWVGLK
jgi:hypothetical protein